MIVVMKLVVLTVSEKQLDINAFFTLCLSHHIIITIEVRTHLGHKLTLVNTYVIYVCSHGIY